MARLNHCFFIGNLTRDPELKYLSSGDAVANVSIACNESWKDKNGEKQESVEFVNLVFYKKLAEIVGELCKKGASIHVEGKMKTRKWEKDGKTSYATEIIVDKMQMLGGKQDSSESKLSTHSTAKANGYQKPADGFDDVPFQP